MEVKVGSFSLGEIGEAEGPTQYPLRLEPKGSINAIMLFVDFPDVPENTNTDQIREKVAGKSQEWFKEESYSKINLTINTISGWRRMPKESHSYGQISSCFNLHKTYITDALNLFPDISFCPDYIVYIVAPPNVGNNLNISPTWRPNIGDGVQLPNGEIRHVVTFCKDAYTRDYRVLCHETGHIFGLPDLYLYGKHFPDDRNPVTGWDVMSCVDCGRHFLGWHRYKLGWLSDSNMVELSFGTIIVKLTSFLKKEGGIKMIKITDPEDPHHKSHIIELSQGIGRFEETMNEGLLVYSIDCSLPGGEGPIQILSATSKNTSDTSSNITIKSNCCKSHAPLKENGLQTFPLRNHQSLLLEILRKHKNNNYTVQVTIIVTQ